MEKDTFYAGVNLQKLHDIITSDSDDASKAGYANFIDSCTEKMKLYRECMKYMTRKKVNNPEVNNPEFRQTYSLANDMYEAYKTIRVAAIKAEKMYNDIVKPEELAEEEEMQAEKDALNKQFEEIMANIERPDELDTIRHVLNLAKQVNKGNASHYAKQE